MENIKLLAFCRQSTGNILYVAIGDKSIEKSIRTEAVDVLNQFNKINLEPNVRHKINLELSGTNYVCFCIRDTQDISYLAICSVSYPERLAYKIISDLTQHFSLLGNNYSKKSDAELITHSQQTADNLLNQYNSEDIDKLLKVNNIVNETKDTMQNNIQGLIENTDDLETARGKMEKLALESSRLKTQSKEVKTIMKYRNIKLGIILALVIIGIIILIVFLILDSKQKVKEDK